MSLSQPTPPTTPQDQPKRAFTFFDGQNIFHAAREAFGYKEPNYDPVALSKQICTEAGWQLQQVRFYTGVPGHQEDPRNYQFWTAKLQGMRNAQVVVFQRPLRYRHKTIRLPLTAVAAKQSRFYLPDGMPLARGEKLYLGNGKELPDGTELTIRVGEEKGIDVRLALDLVGLALDKVYDVAVIFSQDQDLAEAVREIGEIAKRQSRPVLVCSAFPESGNKPRGIDGTRWIKIDSPTYAACLDRRDYHQGPRRRP